MARKRKTLDKYLIENIKNGKSEGVKKVKGVIGTLTNAEDFLITLTILHGQDKNYFETVEYYEALFRRFKLNSLIIDCYEVKQEWHMWTEILIEMSAVLWKWRDKFEPNSWLETNAKIYEVAFGNFQNYENLSINGGLCFKCARLFTEVLFNFSNHARKGDKSGDFHIFDSNIKEISKIIGTRWEAVTYSNLFDEKIKEHS